MHDDQVTTSRHSERALADFQARAQAHAQQRPESRLLRSKDKWFSQFLRLPSYVTTLPPRVATHLLIVGLVVSALLVGRLSPDTQPSAKNNQTPNLVSSHAAGFEQRPLNGANSALARPQPNGVAEDSPLAPSQDSIIAMSTRGASTLSREFQPLTASIAADTANVRNGPGTVFDTVATLPQRQSVTVVAQAENWLQIQTTDNLTAWVAADLVDLPAEQMANIPRAESIPTPPPALIAQASVSELNLRDGPGTGYVRLTKLDEGTEVDLVARAGEWLHVRTADGSSGWVSATYLALQPGVLERVPETTDIPPLEPTLLGTTSETGINLRSGPNTKFASLNKLSADTQLTLLARYQTWYKVQTPNGTQGWVSADLLNVSGYIQRRVPATSDIPALPKPAAPKVAAAAKPAANAGATWVWPTTGKLTSAFGWRILGGQRNFHNGFDIANSAGTKIVAIRSGTVIQAGWCRGYGYCVMIDHGNGLVSEYGHMLSPPPVVRGQFVRAGQLIGYMGATYDRAGGGYATGNHVHMTLKRNGVAINPYIYLP